MSQTVTLVEGRAYVFVAVEHANSEIVDIHAARSANRFEALEPVRQGVLRRHRARRGSWLQLHVRRFPGRDQMYGHRSFAVLRVPTRGEWRRRVRAELVAFARRYNETWLVARHGYKTPARVREEQTMPQIAIDPTLAAQVRNSPWPGFLTGSRATKIVSAAPSGRTLSAPRFYPTGGAQRRAQFFRTSIDLEVVPSNF